MPKAERKTTAKKAERDPHTIEFQTRNETKGSVRFQELDGEGNPIEKVDDEDGAIGSLYVRKSWLEGIGIKGVPEGCTVTIAFR